MLPLLINLVRQLHAAKGPDHPITTAELLHALLQVQKEQDLRAEIALAMDFEPRTSA